MLKLAGLRKSFGSLRAVDGLSFSVDKGDVLGLLGPNGAGKSTTLRMAAGVLIPDEGEIEVGGADMASQRHTAQSSIGYLPEGAPLYQSMTVLEFLNFIARTRAISKNEIRPAIDRSMADIRIGHMARRVIGTLSKGYKRRVALAAAILHEPDLLILDEPLDGLDPNQKRTVRAQITQMAQDKAIVISTHALEEVPLMCNRAIIIHQGRLVAEGTPKDMMDAGEQSGLEAHFANLTDHGLAS